jgi:hypothetical protein
MVMLNDQEIIANTRIVDMKGQGYVEMRIHLPDGDEYVSKAKDAESAKKHIIAWCENVRSYVGQKAEAKKEEAAHAKRQRKSGKAPPPQTSPLTPAEIPPPPALRDPLTGLDGWLEAARKRLTDTNETISELAKERDALRGKIEQYERVLELIGENDDRTTVEKREGDNTEGAGA